MKTHLCVGGPLDGQYRDDVEIELKDREFFVKGAPKGWFFGLVQTTAIAYQYILVPSKEHGAEVWRCM